MKNKRITFLLSFCLPLAIAWGEIPPAKTVFTQYMNQAQTFANNFPREKAYLHFDNTSYYVGDTIWSRLMSLSLKSRLSVRSAAPCMWNWWIRQDI